MEEKLAEVRAIVDRYALFDNVSIFYTIAKRAMDILCSLLGIILLLPVFIITALLVKLTSRGPIFFIQERSGFKGRIFRMIKFRSMVYNADEIFNSVKSMNEVSGHMFKMKADPRATSIGRVIRRISIDELPQLFNILVGDMSIVGPRPPIPREVVKYDAWHDLRLSVKPGLTGLWQVSGRSAVGFDEMVRLDLRYIRERSICYDIKIILRTVFIVFRYSNAF